MEEKKTRISDFINYIEDYDLASVRLLNVLKGNIDCSYNENDFIEDFTDFSFLKLRNVGVKTLSEFNALKTNYLQYIPKQPDCVNETENSSKTYERCSREEFICWLRSDIIKILKTVEDETDFVETALLEKFEREGKIHC